MPPGPNFRLEARTSTPEMRNELCTVIKIFIQLHGIALSYYSGNFATWQMKNGTYHLAYAVKSDGLGCVLFGGLILSCSLNINFHFYSNIVKISGQVVSPKRRTGDIDLGKRRYRLK
jgi:hypothetical protein